MKDKFNNKAMSIINITSRFESSEYVTKMISSCLSFSFESLGMALSSLNACD
jgi:hypothetical protein